MKSENSERLEKMANNPYSNLSEEVQSALANLNSDDSRYQPQNAHELFKLDQAVQIFFVTIDGHVSTFSAPETLRIFQFTEASEDSSNVFLQVHTALKTSQQLPADQQLGKVGSSIVWGAEK